MELGKPQGLRMVKGLKREVEASKFSSESLYLYPICFTCGLLPQSQA